MANLYFCGSLCHKAEPCSSADSFSGIISCGFSDKELALSRKGSC